MMFDRSSNERFFIFGTCVFVLPSRYLQGNIYQILQVSFEAIVLLTRFSTKTVYFILVINLLISIYSKYLLGIIVHLCMFKLYFKRLFY